jgi:hypothetical protein
MFDMVCYIFHGRFTVGLEEVGREVNHHDPVTTLLFTDELEDLIGNVPRDVVERPGRAVAPDDGSTAELDGLLSGRITDVADIDHDAEAVHLADKGAAKLGQTTVRRLDGLHDTGGVGEGVVARVSEGHVANTESCVLTQHGKGIAQLMSTDVGVSDLPNT